MSYLAAKSMACAADKGQESKISPFKQQCALIIGEMPLDGFGVTIRDWGSVALISIMSRRSFQVQPVDQSR
ncbi:hypothetical protein DIZ76_012271 [Coccidioides immitis]|nr:hypothetical protein DIZ76_012271 [Coccidioides immitis]